MRQAGGCEPPACFGTGTAGDRVLATVTWDLLDETEVKVSAWHESYMPTLAGSVFRGLGSFDPA
ncbi:MAG: hypothetical protein P1U49_02460 [Minwuia sp.]|nr:hypothetical protein [Minwuia sp.]